MQLLARYKDTRDGIALALLDIETQEQIHIEDVMVPGTSAMGRAKHWAEMHRHRIVETDWSILTNLQAKAQ